MHQQLTLDEKPIQTKPFRYITLEEQKEFAEFLDKLGIHDLKSIPYNLRPDSSCQDPRHLSSCGPYAKDSYLDIPKRSIVEQLEWCASEYRTYNCTIHITTLRLDIYG